MALPGVGCISTMKARRRGIIMRTPSTPPQSESRSVRVQSISKPSRTSAGRVKATPAAIDSPAEPVVCTRQFSRMEARPRGIRWEKARKSEIERTAMGTEADTVRPTRKAR